MYAVTGITGQVGGAVGQALLAAGKNVRAVMRDPHKSKIWADLGCDIALAEINDGKALAQAFAGADSVFILLPPAFDPAPGFPALRSILDALSHALGAAQPAKIVALSTIGAQAQQESLLTQLALMEAALGAMLIPVTFLRAA